MKATFTQIKSSSQRGFSLVEMIVTIAVLGVLASVGVMSLTSVSASSKAVVARNLVETLNTGIHRFNESNYELYYNPLSFSAQDEMVVLRTMQYRDPNHPAIGSPYVRPDFNPTTTNSTTEYRVMWTGTLYKLLPPGTAGYGLKVVYDASDITTPYAFPAGFSLAGR